MEDKDKDLFLLDKDLFLPPPLSMSSSISRLYVPNFVSPSSSSTSIESKQVNDSTRPLKVYSRRRAPNSNPTHDQELESEPVSEDKAFDNLLRKLHKYVPSGASVADLYAGAGVIGLSLAATKKCRSVKCIEINKESRPSFEKTVDRLPNSIEGSISWHNADTSIDPLSWLVGSDVIVVDPPRKGLDTSLIDALRTISPHKVKLKSSSSNIKEEKRPWVLRERERTKAASIQVGRETISEDPQSLPETLIYISCGWESFKEDCKSLLTSKSWHLEKAHGFNFFPGTQSIEVLAVFKRSLKKKKTGKKKKKHA